MSRYLQPGHVKSCIYFLVIGFSLGALWQCLINKCSDLRKDVKDWRCLRCISKSIFKEVTSGDSLQCITAFSSSAAKHNNCRGKKNDKAKQNQKFEGFHLVLMKQKKNHLSQPKTFSSSEKKKLSIIQKSFKTLPSYLLFLLN